MERLTQLLEISPTDHYEMLYHYKLPRFIAAPTAPVLCLKTTEGIAAHYVFLQAFIRNYAFTHLVRIRQGQVNQPEDDTDSDNGGNSSNDDGNDSNNQSGLGTSQRTGRFEDNSSLIAPNEFHEQSDSHSEVSDGYQSSEYYLDGYQDLNGNQVHVNSGSSRQYESEEGTGSVSIGSDQQCFSEESGNEYPNSGSERQSSLSVNGSVRSASPIGDSICSASPGGSIYSASPGGSIYSAQSDSGSVYSASPVNGSAYSAPSVNSDSVSHSS